jgi:hypothetical protein
MRIAVTSCRSASTGLKVLFGCLILSLLACQPAAAQNETFTPVVAPLMDYAELSFVVPSEVTSEGESRFEDNYSVGRYVAASILLNGSRVYTFLLYPCDAPETWLDAFGVKAAVETFNTGLNRTIYSPTPLNISSQPAIWGELENQILVAYQPSVETVSITFIDENITESVLEYLLGSLQINVSESASPLWPGYCTGGEGEGAAEAEVQPEQTGGMETEQTNVTEQTVEPEEIAETNQSEGKAPEFNKEQVEADLKAIEERMEALKRW